MTTKKTLYEYLNKTEVLGTDIVSISINTGFDSHHKNYKACATIISQTFFKTPDDGVQSIQEFLDKFDVQIIIIPKDE